MVITGNVLLDIVAVVVALVAALIASIKWRYSYWARIGLEYPEPTFPFGNIWGTITRKKTDGEGLADIYFTMKAKGLRHAGLFVFHLPVYLAIDPEIVKHIMQVDFDHFVDRGVYFNEKHDPLSAHLFSLEGNRWKNLRAKVSPTFTSGKMKMMFPIVVKTSEQVIEVLDGHCSGKSAEIKEILARLTTDIIGTCAFGLDCNSLRDPDTEFRKQGKKFFDNTGLQRMNMLLGFLFPKLSKLLHIKTVAPSLSAFFTGVVQDTIEYRESKHVKRNDFMQLLIEMKSDGKSSVQGTKSSLTFDEIAAQAFIFFLAGFETSSTTMSFCMYELSVNEDIQEKVRREIDTVLAKHNGEFTYEAMMEMHYMEKVINETLRKYPPVMSLTRMTLKDYKVPNSDIVLQKGVRVFIPVQGLHHDPEFYPSPDVFDPSRFDEEKKQARHPFTFLPFGEGPRICVGLRFGVMQTKVGLTVLLKNYRFKLNAQTQTPLRLDPENFLTSAVGGIWMNIEKISGDNK